MKLHELLFQKTRWSEWTGTSGGFLHLQKMKEHGTNKRIFGLDILRAAAILFVMQMHSLTFIRPHANVDYYHLFILDGVDLFFVLSGFLIGGILIRTINDTGLSRNQLTIFWARRWFRTLPDYFLVLVVLIIGYRYAFNVFPDKMPEFFFFFQNFASPHPHFFPEAWSLAVEEWFYLLVPLGLFFVIRMGKNKKKNILLWICFVLIAITVFRIYKAWSHQYIEDRTWDENIRKQVLTRLDSIMYGFLGAWLYCYKPVAWNKRKNLLLIAGILILFGSRVISAQSIAYYKYVYISAQSIGTLCLLPKLNSIVKGKGILYRAFTFISIVSYSMYLLNYTIMLKIVIPGIMRISGMNYEQNIFHAAICYILFWGLTISFSWLLYRFYEKPMMNLREKLRLKKAEGAIPMN
jgi:peptidoglycan/LPS O-acetylase OafA/YrhL